VPIVVFPTWRGPPRSWMRPGAGSRSLSPSSSLHWRNVSRNLSVDTTRIIIRVRLTVNRDTFFVAIPRPVQIPITTEGDVPNVPMFPQCFSPQPAPEPRRPTRRWGAKEDGHEGIGREVPRARAGGNPILVVPAVVLVGWKLAPSYTLFVAFRASAPEVQRDRRAAAAGRYRAAAADRAICSRRLKSRRVATDRD
jgi:hypothetical protein